MSLEDLAEQLKEKIRLKALWIELLAEAEAEDDFREHPRFDAHIVDEEDL